MPELIKGLSILIWLQGIILCLFGVFYLFTAAFTQPATNRVERRRISILFGLSGLGIGLGMIANGWARGLIRYLDSGGAVWVGGAVLVVSLVTVVVMAVALIDVVLTWVRGNSRERPTADNERDDLDA